MSYASNIPKFYAFRILSALELTLSIFVLFLLANELTMTEVMSLETIFIAVVLLLEVPSGAVADLFGRKRSVSLAMLFTALAFAIFGAGSTYWVFLVAQLLVALGWALTSGADSALVYDTLKELGREHEYARIFGRGNFFMLSTYAVAALASGLLAMLLDYRTIFFVTALLFGAAALVGATMREPPLHRPVHGRRYLEHLLGAVRFAGAHRRVRNLIIYYGAFAAAGHLAWFLIQPFYEQGGYPLFVIGLATFLYFAAAGFGTLTADAFARRFREQPLLLSLLFLAGASFALIFVVSKLAALLCIVVISFVCGVRDIVVNNSINRHTDSHHRATVVSIQSMSKSVMYALFAPLIGLFTDLFTPAAAFLMMGVGLLLIFTVYGVLALLGRKAL